MAYAEKIESFGDTNWYLVDRKPYRTIRIKKDYLTDASPKSNRNGKR